MARMLVNRGIPAPQHAALEAEVAAHALLEDVVRWALARGAEIVDVVVQDEFTHDVVVALGGPVHLVYSTT